MIKPAARSLPIAGRVMLVGALLTGCSQSHASSSGGEVVQNDGELERAIAANPVLRAAVKSIDAGHPWKATLAVAPVVAKNPRDHAATLVAARAAAAWEGWNE